MNSAEKNNVPQNSLEAILHADLNKSTETPSEASPMETDVCHDNKIEQTATIKPDINIRRSSSRSIKRPKFDDELIDAGYRKGLARKILESSPSDSKVKRNSKQSTNQLPKKNSNKIKSSPVPSDFGRWRPSDDLKLIVAVQQTCDLQVVHMAVKFSCTFSLKEIQDRWFALLYDPLLSRLSQQSVKSLPADVVNRIIKDVLWSRDEESILCDVDMADQPDVASFQKLLDKHLNVFHKIRTAEDLKEHWLMLRHYDLLNCQTVKPTLGQGVSTSISSMEAKIVSEQLKGKGDLALKQELLWNDRGAKREIKKLEREIPQWELLLEKSGCLDFQLNPFKEDDLATFTGRILKYSMKTKQMIIGRPGYGYDVDLDLSIEGPARKVSRQQGLVTYDCGHFYLKNIGRIPIYVSGEALLKNNQAEIFDNSVIEIYCMKFLFNINPALNSCKTNPPADDAT